MNVIAKMGIALAALAALACTPAPKDPAELPGLKDAYKDAFKIGAAVSSFELSGRNPEYEALILKNFNTLTPGNELKPESLHPRPDVWNWERADRYVDFAVEHDMFVMGHTLCWHNQTPEFFWNDAKGNPKSHDELVETLRSYIETVCTHFKGRVDAWDVIKARNTATRSSRPCSASPSSTRPTPNSTTMSSTCGGRPSSRGSCTS